MQKQRVKKQGAHKQQFPKQSSGTKTPNTKAQEVAQYRQSVLVRDGLIMMLLVPGIYLK